MMCIFLPMPVYTDGGMAYLSVSAGVHAWRCSLGSSSPCQEELGQSVQKSRERIQDADAVLLNACK